MQIFYIIRGGTQKFPELLKKNYLKYFYKFETLVALEVLPPPATGCSSHNAAPNAGNTVSNLQWKCCVKGRHRFSLDLCNISKLPALQILLQSWEPNESQEAWSGKGLGGPGGHNHYFVFSQKEGFC
jgi:hypothetical protein